MVNIAEFRDSVSLKYGDKSGQTFCGARSYAFSPSDIVTLGTSQTEWHLQVSSNDGYTSGQTIPVTVSVSLEFSSITSN